MYRGPALVALSVVAVWAPGASPASPDAMTDAGGAAVACDYDRNPPLTAVPLPPAPPPTHIAVPHMAYTAHYRPCFPATAVRAGHYGTVLLSFHVDAHGNVLEVQVKAGTGFPELDASALDAARHWKFFPAEREGVAYASWQDVPVSFPKP